MKLKRGLFICLMVCVCVLCACFVATPVLGACADSPNYNIITADAPDGFVRICADLNRFGALDRDGRVYIFGDGAERSYMPPLDLPPIIDIAMGNFHVVALDRNGKVYSWGNARESGCDFGQTNFPEDLPPIKAIAAGGYKTMLLTEDGKVLSFGDTNDGGQEHVPDMPRVVAIACSAYTSLALDKDGYVHAWGIGHLPSKTIGPNVTGISAVNYDFVYLGADGRILEERDASIYSDMGDLAYRPFPYLSNITKIAGSSQNYAAIDLKGNVLVWGYYTNNSNPAFNVVNVPGELPPIKDIGFTIDSAAALGVDGKIYEWGIASRSNLVSPVNEAPSEADEPDVSVTPHEEHKEPFLPLYLPGIILVAFVICFFIYRAKSLRGNSRAKDEDTAADTTGNQKLDEILSGISEHISNLRRLDKSVQGKLDEPVQDILNTTEQIVEQLRKHPAGIGDIHQFFNYTLPTTINLLQNYDEFSKQPLQGRNIRAAMEKIEGMMNTIVDAFHRQLDALFQDQAMNIDIEIDVMKNMLSQAEDIADITYSNADEEIEPQIHKRG